jgi:tetratricopeptide (TPR) repeat protein
MLKGLCAFLVLSAAALGQCSQYADIAQNYLASGSCYPNCFPAAQEYYQAARCYADTGDSAGSAKYYDLAAKTFIEAQSFLVKSGDYRLAGKSYEFAADSYKAIGRTDLAGTYYGAARDIFMTNGFDNELAALDAKLAPAKPATTPISGNVVYSLSPSGILALIALFFSIGSIAFILYSHMPARTSEYSFTRPSAPARKPPATDVLDELMEEAPKPAAREAPKPPADSAVVARERAKEKLRRKYVR